MPFARTWMFHFVGYRRDAWAVGHKSFTASNRPTPYFCGVAWSANASLHEMQRFIAPDAKHRALSERGERYAD